MHKESRLAHNWLIKKLVNDRVRDHLPALHGSVLDAGCGTRPYQPDILRHADWCVGLDWAHSVHGLHADVLADLARPLPLQDACMDCAVCFEVLEHVPEPAALLGELHRVLRPQGILLLSVPFQWWVHEAPYDFYRYTRHGLERLLTGAGFVDVRVEATSGFWSMWLLKLNYQLARAVTGSKWRRRITRALLIPVWWLNQQVAPRLDALWPDERETAGYFVRARRP